MIDWDSQWMPVPGHPDYDAHPSGAVRSRKRGEPRELVGWLDGNGYHRVHLDDAHYATHAIIALTFHGPRPEGMQTRHLNGNPLDNRAENLQYGTPAENQADRWAHGTHPALAITECPKGHPYPPAQPGQRRTCADCRPIMKRRYVRKNVGVAVECDKCGREVSKLNIHRHKKTDYCNGRTTGRWQ